jgi:adenosine deaminase
MHTHTRTQAITALHADRIGHGTFVFDADLVRDDMIKDKESFVLRLANHLADRRITIEV